MVGKYTKVKSIISLRRADHIAIWDYSRFPLSYQHHGIVWKEGSTLEEVLVCHIWSPLEGFRDAQADSCFRVSTLNEFLYNRSSKHLRLVEYHTSAFRELFSSWGEVHLTKSDIPEIVLARCKFLMGLGKGDFHIYTQNCEHAAHWCKTGEQWCKQNLTRGKGSIPFEETIDEERILELESEITRYKEKATREVERILELSGNRVCVQVNGSHYLRVTEKDQVDVVPMSTLDMSKCSVFRIRCYSKGYNCVKLTLFHERSEKYMFSRSTFSCFRDIRMKKRTFLRGSTGLKWELSSCGYLKSMNQHRRYLGVRHDSLLVDVSIRDDAATFKLFRVDDENSDNSCIRLPVVRQPSDYNIFNSSDETTHSDRDSEDPKSTMARINSKRSWKVGAYRELVDEDTNSNRGIKSSNNRSIPLWGLLKKRSKDTR